MQKKIIAGFKSIDVLRQPYKIKKDADAFIKVLKDQHITRLFHFTDVVNLPSIIKHKSLFSIEFLNKVGIKPKVSDPIRWDGMRNHINTSLSMPNFVLLGIYQQRYPKAKYAMIEIDPTVICKLNTQFVPFNASKKEAASARGYTLEHFKKILKVPKGDSRFDISLFFSLAVDIKAEVMIEETIPAEKIKAIHIPKAGYIPEYESCKKKSFVPIKISPQWFNVYEARKFIIHEVINKFDKMGFLYEIANEQQEIDIDRLVENAIRNNVADEAFLRSLLEEAALREYYYKQTSYVVDQLIQGIIPFVDKETREPSFSETIRWIMDSVSEPMLSWNVVRTFIEQQGYDEVDSLYQDLYEMFRDPYSWEIEEANWDKEFP
ncbi:MAG: DUF4433 domain-containing protein, partial [Candidatus Margulisbacteria bacterium]|nr:DUF4433 domain-containing protein [Candidatus Margulisiibacteriota bacterium]